MGKSRPWEDAFQNVTGYRELTAQPIKDYFKVLYDWMKEQRAKEGYSLGWKQMNPTSTPANTSPKVPTTKPVGGAVGISCAKFLLVISFFVAILNAMR